MRISSNCRPVLFAALPVLLSLGFMSRSFAEAANNVGKGVRISNKKANKENEGDKKNKGFRFAWDKQQDVPKKNQLKAGQDQDKMKAKSAKAAEKHVEIGMDMVGDGTFHLAMQSFRKAMVDCRGDPAVLKNLDDLCRKRYGMSLTDITVETYFQEDCKKCGGKGVIECKKCNGFGYGISWPNSKDGGSNYIGGLTFPGTNGVHRVVQSCALCKTHGYEYCNECGTTGIKLMKPVGPEKSRFVQMLLEKAKDELNTNQETQFDTSSEYEAPSEKPSEIQNTAGGINKPRETQVKLQDSANRVKSNILRLTKADYYLRWAIQIHPPFALGSTKELGFNPTIDPVKTRRQIIERGRHLVGELGVRQFMLNSATFDPDRSSEGGNDAFK